MDSKLRKCVGFKERRNSPQTTTSDSSVLRPMLPRADEPTRQHLVLPNPTTTNKSGVTELANRPKVSCSSSNGNENARVSSAATDVANHCPKGVYIPPYYNSDDPPARRAVAIQRGARLLLDEIERAINYPVLFDYLIDTTAHCAACIGDDGVLLTFTRWALPPSNPAGLTPFWLAAWNDHLDLVGRLLVRPEFKKEIADAAAFNGVTPLMIAAAEGHFDMVKLLVEADANIHIRDIDGRTALTHASDNKRQDVVNFLKSKLDADVKHTTVKDGSDGEERVDERQLQERLVRAAGLGDRHAVERLLKEGAKCDGPGTEYLPLAVAASSGSTEIVELLLENGAEIKSYDSFFINPLAAGAGKNHREIVQLLLERGAKDDKAALRRAVCAATAGGHVKLIELLVHEGADVNDDRLAQLAARNGDWKTVELLLKLGFEISSPTVLGDVLMAAARSGDAKTVEVLLRNCANVTLSREKTCAVLNEAVASGDIPTVKLLIGDGGIGGTDKNGYSALHYAAEHGHADVVNLLLDEYGADINSKSNDGFSPLLSAIHSHSDTIATLMASRGCDLDGECHGRDSPLRQAVQFGCPAVVKALIDVHADVSLRVIDISSGLTPLMVAVGLDKYDVGKVLCQYSKDFSITEASIYPSAEIQCECKRFSCGIDSVINLFDRDSTGMTALMYAAHECNGKFVKLLLEDARSHVMINLQDNGGRTALHYAAMDKVEKYRDEQTIILELLLENGADCNREDNNGQTALHYASKNLTENKKSSQFHVVEKLFKEGAYVNSRDNAGRTALHYAVMDIGLRDEDEQLDLAATLMRKGADASVPDYDDMTPLELVEEQRRRPVTTVRSIRHSDIGNALLSTGSASVAEKKVKTLADKLEKTLNTGKRCGEKDPNGVKPIEYVESDGRRQQRKPWENTKYLNADTDAHVWAITGADDDDQFVSYIGSARNDLEKKNRFGRTPLSLAAVYGNVQTLETMLVLTRPFRPEVHDDSKPVSTRSKHPVGMDYTTLLHLAASSRLTSNSKYDRKANANNDQTAPENSPETINDGGTKFEIIYKLLQKELHTDIANEQDKQENTPLHCACLARNLNAVRVLKCEGNALAITNIKGWTPLHSAIGTNVSSFDSKLAEELINELLLVDNLKAIYKRDKRGCNLLHLAVRTGRSTIIPKLSRLNPEQLNVDGLSPLHLAAARGASADTLRAILETFYSTDPDEYIRDVDHATHDGITALFICIENGDVEKIELLLNYGSNLSRRANDGLPVMHHLARTMARRQIMGGEKEAKNAARDVLQVVLKRSVFWWCRQRNQSRDVFLEDTDDYRDANRRAVMELTCHTRYRGQNSLQFAASQRSYLFLDLMLNTYDVFTYATDDSVRYCINYLTIETMHSSSVYFHQQRNRSCLRSEKVNSRFSDARRFTTRDEKSVLEHIVNVAYADAEKTNGAIGILRKPPFKQLIEPYWTIIQVIYFLLFTVHMTHMITFTSFAIPDSKWLNLRFPNADAYFTVNDSKPYERNVNSRPTFFSSSEMDETVHKDSCNVFSWHSGLFVIWPSINFLFEIFNLVEKWRFMISSVDQSDDSMEGSTGNSRKRFFRPTLLRFVGNCLLVILYPVSFTILTITWLIIYAASDRRHVYLSVTALVLVVGWTYTLNFLMIFSGFTTLVGVLKRIIIGDVVKFSVIFGFVLLSFSLAFFVLSLQVNGRNENFASIVLSVYTVYGQMLQFESVFEKMNFDSESLPAAYLSFVRIVLVVFISISTVIFLNLLIAMMTGTYDDAVKKARQEMKADYLRMLGRLMTLERQRFSRPIIKWILRLLHSSAGLTISKSLPRIRSYSDGFEFRKPDDYVNQVLDWDLKISKKTFLKNHSVLTVESELLLARVEALENSMSVLFSQIQPIITELRSATDIKRTKQTKAASTRARLEAVEHSVSELVKQNQSFMSELVNQNHSIISELKAKIGSGMVT